METTDDPFLGKRIRGYYLEERLGRGTLTAIYRGRTEEHWLVPELMITFLLVPQTLSDQARANFRTRFNHQARQFALLRHPHLFPLYGYDEQEDLFYLLNPLQEGEMLIHHLRQKRKWSLSEILSILRPLAELFDYLYDQEVAQPFFSPANVLMQDDGTVLLSGFGLTQLLAMKGLNDEHVDTSTYEHLKSIVGSFLGAPEYLAPEIVKGAEADRRSAVYALGILLFEMLSGTPPFTGHSYLEIAQKHVKEPLPSLHRLAPDLPIAPELVVNRALQRNPERRFQSLEEFINAFTYVVNENMNAPKSGDLVRAIERIKAHPLLSGPAPHPLLVAPQPILLLAPQEPLLLAEQTEDEERQEGDRQSTPSVLASAPSSPDEGDAANDETDLKDESASIFEAPTVLLPPLSSLQDLEDDSWLNDMSQAKPATQEKKSPAPAQQDEPPEELDLIDQSAPAQQDEPPAPTQQAEPPEPAPQAEPAGPVRQADSLEELTRIDQPVSTQQTDQFMLTPQDEPPAPTRQVDQPVHTQMIEMAKQLQQIRERLRSQ